MTTRPRSVLTFAFLTLLAASVAGPAAAQQLTHPGPPIEGQDGRNGPASPGTTEVGTPSPLPDYGTSNWMAYTLGACDVLPQTGGGAVDNHVCEYVEASAPSTTAYVGAGLHLPGGALVQYIRIFFWASTAGLTPALALDKVANTDGTVTHITVVLPTSVAGNQTVLSPLFSETVNNAAYTYLFRAAFPRGASTTMQFRQGVVYYKLQVSPAPAVASFTDVPTSHWAFQYIEALKASGITGGCAVGMFCPNNNVTRAEMAVFLASALGLQYDY